ncbi:hypothetical protein RB595_010474 [Gaeumannomyces hyphopodioides]
MSDHIQANNHDGGQGHPSMDPKASSKATALDASRINQESKIACRQEAGKGKLGGLGHIKNTQPVSDSSHVTLLNTQKQEIDTLEDRLKLTTGLYKAKVEQLSNANTKLDESKRAYAALKEKADTELAKKNSIIDGLEKDANVKLDKAKEAQAKMDEKDGLIAKLQQEALAHVDRHEPVFDSTIASAFDKINRKINALVRRNATVSTRGDASTPPELTTLDKLAQVLPLEQWGKGAVKPQWYHQDVSRAWQSDHSVRALVLRAMVWNFLKRELFNDDRPFAVLGSIVSEAYRQYYTDVFPNHATSVEAAKWRALTAKCLADVEAKNPAVQATVLDRLKSAFLELLYSDVATKLNWQPPLTLDYFRGVMEGNIARELEPVLQAAIDLATITSRERARYQLWFPDLEAYEYHRIAGQPLMTTDQTSLAINARTAQGHDDDDEEGPISLVASPVLLKWGNGAGERLNEHTVLRKAFVWYPNEGQA